jgi:hypothetical protein
MLIKDPNEEVPKRARPFLDLTAKHAKRCQALQDYAAHLGAEERPDALRRFVAGHFDAVVQFVLDDLALWQSRLGQPDTARDADARLRRHLRQDLGCAVLLLDYLLPYAPPERLATHEHLSRLVNVARVLLHPGNALEVRVWGLDVVLAWTTTRHGRHCPTIVSNGLFGSMIRLPGIVAEFPLLTASEQPLLKNLHSSATDELALLERMLRSSEAEHLPLIKTHYLDILYRPEDPEFKFVDADVQAVVINNLPTDRNEGQLAFWRHHPRTVLKVLQLAFKLPYGSYSVIKRAIDLGKQLFCLKNSSDASDNKDDDAERAEKREEGVLQLAKVMLTLFDRRAHIGYAAEQADSFQQAWYFFAHHVALQHGAKGERWQRQRVRAVEGLVASGKVAFSSPELIVQPALRHDLQRLWASLLWATVLQHSKDGVALDGVQAEETEEEEYAEERQLWEMISTGHAEFAAPDCTLGQVQEWSRVMHRLTDSLLLPTSSVPCRKRAFFWWRNVLRAVGPISRYLQARDPPAHELIVLTFARLADQLMASNGGEDVCWLLRDLAPVLLYASQLDLKSISSYSPGDLGSVQRSRLAAVAVVCKVFCSSSSSILSQDPVLLGGLYGTIQQGLQEVISKVQTPNTEQDELELMTVVVEGLSDVFSHGLVDSLEKLLMPMLRAFDAISQTPSGRQLLQLKLWDVCRFLGDAKLLLHTHIHRPPQHDLVDLDAALDKAIADVYDRVVREHVPSQGPFACTLSCLILQLVIYEAEHTSEAVDSYLRMLLEMCIPRSPDVKGATSASHNATVNPLTIQSLQSLAAGPLSSSFKSHLSSSSSLRTRIIVERLILAARSCLLPVPGGDNASLDDSGALLLECLASFILIEPTLLTCRHDDGECAGKRTNDHDVLRDVAALVRDCQQGHVVPARRTPRMTTAAVYLEHVVLSHHHNLDQLEKRGELNLSRERVVVFDAVSQLPASLISLSSSELRCQLLNRTYRWSLQPVVEFEHEEEGAKSMMLTFPDCEVLDDVLPFMPDEELDGEAIDEDAVQGAEDPVRRVLSYMHREHPQFMQSTDGFGDALYDRDLQDLLARLHQHELRIAEHYRHLQRLQPPTCIDQKSEAGDRPRSFDLLANLGLTGVAAWSQRVMRRLKSNQSDEPQMDDRIRVSIGAKDPQRAEDWLSLLGDNVDGLKYTTDDEGQAYVLIGEGLPTSSSMQPPKPTLQVHMGKGCHVSYHYETNENAASNKERVAGPLGYGTAIADLQHLPVLLHSTLCSLFAIPLADRYIPAIFMHV